MRVPVPGFLALILPLVLVSWPAAAGGGQQREEVVQPDRADQDRRYQISVMEGVLERAAANGAAQTSRRFQQHVPEPLLWNGPSRARGFRLDDYGLFFHVEVPALRGSLLWSYQVLTETPNDIESSLGNEFRTLREQIKQLADPVRRQELDQTIQRLQVVVLGGDAPARAVVRRSRPPLDLNETYTSDVKDAIVQAMLDHSSALQLGAGEWLTVAVRDSEPGPIVPGQPYDLMTITLRVKGSDLASFHGGKLSREEIIERVHVREF